MLDFRANLPFRPGYSSSLACKLPPPSFCVPLPGGNNTIRLKKPVEQDHSQKYQCQDGKTPCEIPSIYCKQFPCAIKRSCLLHLSLHFFLIRSFSFSCLGLDLSKIPKVQPPTGICFRRIVLTVDMVFRILRHLQLSDGILCIFHFSQSCLHSFLSLGPKAYSTPLINELNTSSIFDPKPSSSWHG